MSIDYGRYPMKNGSLPNRDPETNTRYGIADMNDLADWVQDELEGVYDYGCPHCGELFDEEWEGEANCPHCGKFVDHGEDVPDEASAWIFNDGSIYAEWNSFGFWIYKSPVITYGDHCSPCCPGAVSIYPPPYDGNVAAYGLPDEFWRKNEE